MTWRQAYLRQAVADFTLYQELTRDRRPLCHRLHYLQMATEKMAKFQLTKVSGGPHRPTHVVLVAFLKLIKGRPEIRRKMGYPEKGNAAAYWAYIDSLLPTAEKIQALAPVGGNFKKVNAEYPWEDSDSDRVIAPIDHGFPEFDRHELLKFQTFMENFIRISSP